MATPPAVESLERLRELQRELLSLTETTANIEALCTELESNIQAFRDLAKEPARSDASRRALQSGTVDIHGEQYSVTEVFKQQSIELSDALDLDEVQAATLLFDCQKNSDELDRPQIISAIFTFHQIRQYTFECLRLVLEKSTDVNVDSEICSVLDRAIALILGQDEGRAPQPPLFLRKCLETMDELEQWSGRVAERIQRVSVTEQTESAEFAEIMEYQRSSIFNQHESLGAIAYRLSASGATNAEQTRWLLTRLKNADKYDGFLLHKLPSLFHSLTSLGSSDNECGPQEARAIHNAVTSFKDNDAWSFASLQAAASMMWVAAYSARFVDFSGARNQGAPSPRELTDCENSFSKALEHGALQFALACSNDVRRSDWFDPAKQGLHAFLIQDTPALHVDPIPVHEFLTDVMMFALQEFVENVISNMPDALRSLKWEEDEQRRQMQGRLNLRPSEYDLHLERLLMLISNAWSGYNEALDFWWNPSEQCSRGFLDWASTRQSTPRVAAFCEVLQALSGDQNTSDKTHNFLIENSHTGSGRIRRASPISWTHILRELEFYASTIRDKLANQNVGGIGGRSYPDLTVEPESAVMLECYLRLIAHLSTRSVDARQFLHRGPVDLLENLMSLYGSMIPARLRACAFTALRGLLSDKSKELRDNVWSRIDGWIYAQPHAAAVQTGRQPPAPGQIPNVDKINFERISPDFEEPNAFVSLLRTLMEPVQKEIPVKDSLPFPEDLGARYRMSGVEPYVDFVMGLVFATKSATLSDPLQLRIMRWNCLSFAASCLSDFNEDLIVLANRSKIAVESAIETSSLTAYVRLHPFARVMEWLFNDQVITGLFAAVLQDVAEVNAAASDSPLVLSLMSSLETIELVLGLQRTYFDIVRPHIKTQANGRRNVVANSALATFEDAIATHLDLIYVLGLYCSSGHAELAVTALRLLKRLSESRKLAVPLKGRSTRAPEKSRLIAALERDQESDSISRGLANIMQFDSGELEPTGDSPGLIIKSNLLDFLSSSLDAVVNQPTLAHLLLGFACSPQSVYVDSECLFGTEQSLFDSIASFSTTTVDKDDLMYHSALVQIRNKAVQVIRRLWRLPIASHLVLNELRDPAYDYFFAQAVSQTVISAHTAWDGYTVRDGQFWTQDSAQGYASFLHMRNAFYELAAIEIRAAQAARRGTYKARILSALFGSTKLSSGEVFHTPTLFDLLDFIDLPDNQRFDFPQSQYFEEALFDTCKAEDFNGVFRYTLGGVRQILMMRQSEILKQAAQFGEQDRQNVAVDAAEIYSWAVACNNVNDVVEARRETLKSWVTLAMVVLQIEDTTPDARRSLALQLLQLVLPKFERSLQDDIPTAEVFAALMLALQRNVEFVADNERGNVLGEEAYDRLFEMFRTCLAGIQCPESTNTLRQLCALACRTFIMNSCLQGQKSVRRITSAVKSFGERLMDLLCDDAYAGDDQNRIATLMLLDSIVCASNLSHSKYILEAFNHRNFIQVTVGMLAKIGSELQQPDIPALMVKHDCINAGLALLARVAQTRHGGATVLGAGIFSSLRDSGIFSVDPDIGFDFDDAAALARFYELMLGALRIVNCVVTSQSEENEQTIHQTRLFLHEYRPSMTSVFKRSAGIGNVATENVGILSELVDNYTALIVATGFMESAEERPMPNGIPRVFT